jgi:hypothetical protein
MILMRLLGGLGNQLFQYSLGRNLSIIKNSTLYLDLSKLHDSEIPRQYQLDHFQIKAQIASQNLVKKFVIPDRVDWPGRIRYWAERKLPYYYRSYIKEQSIGFDPKIFRVRKNVCLEGYWQSECYFSRIRDILLSEITLRDPTDQIFNDLEKNITRSNSISIHIRRQDYVTVPQFTQYHGVCSLDYYHQAIGLLSSRVRAPVFFVFSDDMNWVKNNVDIKYPACFVDLDIAGKDYQELVLLSKCKHHIIANSSFSWWGAWICNQPGKTVIAPKRWFRDPKIITDDLVPQTWTRL